jgi:dTDP-L-rhamnose 4-epimerase
LANQGIEMKKVLVTGGCGFVGKVLCLRLVQSGYEVRILDSLTEKIHGSSPDLRWIEENRILLIRSSVTNRQHCKTALEGIDVVVHLASETGTGQSMYRVTSHVKTNILGIAMLLEECRARKVKRFVLASSRAVYGEGHGNALNAVGSTPEQEALMRPDPITGIPSVLAAANLARDCYLSEKTTL